MQKLNDSNDDARELEQTLAQIVRFVWDAPIVSHDRSTGRAAIRTSPNQLAQASCQSDLIADAVFREALPSGNVCQNPSKQRANKRQKDSSRDAGAGRALVVGHWTLEVDAYANKYF